MKILGTVAQLIIRIPGGALELEKISGDHGKRGAPRFSSEGEIGYLRRLVERHGGDVEAMARDRKLNPDQRTVGELRRLMKNAGGLGNFVCGIGGAMNGTMG